MKRGVHHDQGQVERFTQSISRNSGPNEATRAGLRDLTKRYFSNHTDGMRISRVFLDKIPQKVVLKFNSDLVCNQCSVAESMQITRLGLPSFR